MDHTYWLSSHWIIKTTALTANRSNSHCDEWVKKKNQHSPRSPHFGECLNLLGAQEAYFENLMKTSLLLNMYTCTKRHISKMCSNYTGAQEWNPSFMLKWGNGTYRWMDRLHEREPVISAAFKKRKITSWKHCELRRPRWCHPTLEFWVFLVRKKQTIILPFRY